MATNFKKIYRVNLPINGNSVVEIEAIDAEDAQKKVTELLAKQNQAEAITEPELQTEKSISKKLNFKKK